jgi:glycyl-tRNA synthetase
MVDLKTLSSFCKRRGFVFPSSEIYDGFAAVYDYGHYGTELSNNIKSWWHKNMVQFRDDVVGLDSGIFMNPKIWEASGHVGGFSDPLSECKNCHMRFRVDHILEDLGIQADEKMSEEEINKLWEENSVRVNCSNCGQKSWDIVKKFNLLVKSNLGDFTSKNENPVYLRGETCQGIYVNFKNVVDSSRVKIPFGIAQIGKAFRNEITARQFIFRTREFEQMEMQFFTHPKTTLEWYEKWKEIRMNYYLDLGIKPENLRFKEHENLVFYAKAAFDIEYNFNFGWKEIEGLHHRGDYDLTQHSKFSGQKLEYKDQVTGESYIPHIVECSSGVARVFLAVLSEAYVEEKISEDDTRIVLRLPKILAPVKVAILPLLKNKEELTKKAEEIYLDLRQHFMVEYDESGTVGKRYRRQDEIGTPYCVTIDFDTLEDGTVTVRDRDSMEQIRLKIDELKTYLLNNLN